MTRTKTPLRDTAPPPDRMRMEHKEGRIYFRFPPPLGDQPELQDLWVPGLSPGASDEKGVPPAEVVQRLVTATARVAPTLPQERQAHLYKANGTFSEMVGLLRQALAQYELALDADPNIGVKKKIVDLRLRLGVTAEKESP